MRSASFIILVVAVAIQCCMPYNEAARVRDDPDDLLARLEKILNEAVDSAVKRLDTVKKDFHKQVDDSIENSGKHIEEKQEQYLEKLEKLKEDGEAQGKVVDECVAGKAEDFQNLTDVYQEKGVSCGEDKKKEADDIIDNVILKIEDTHNDVLELNEELRACGDGVFSIVCKGKVAAKITLAITVLPAKITSDVYEATKLIGKLALGECTSDNEDALSREADRVIYSVRICISNLPGTTTGGSTSDASSASTEVSTEDSSPVTSPDDLF